MPFFSSDSDSALLDQMVIADPDVFVSKYESEKTGVETEDGDDITLTPVVSPAYTINAYASTVGLNLVVKADSNKVFIGKVKSNTDAAIVFDSTSMVNLADGTAGAATDWAVASSYEYYVLTANSTYAWGDYFGHVKEITIGIEESRKEFELGVPKESIVDDLISMKYMAKGQNFQFVNKDVWHAIMGSTQRGSQTGQWETHGGFAPATRQFYRMTLVGQTRIGKAITFQYFRGQFQIEGDLPLSTEDYKFLGFTFTAKKDAFRIGTANAYMKRVAE